MELTVVDIVHGRSHDMQVSSTISRNFHTLCKIVVCTTILVSSLASGCSTGAAETGCSSSSCAACRCPRLHLPFSSGDDDVRAWCAGGGLTTASQHPISSCCWGEQLWFPQPVEQVGIEQLLLNWVLKVPRLKSPHARGGKKNARVMVRIPRYARQRRSRHNNTAAAHLSLQTSFHPTHRRLPKSLPVSLSLCLGCMLSDDWQLLHDDGEEPSPLWWMCWVMHNLLYGVIISDLSSALIGGLGLIDPPGRDHIGETRKQPVLLIGRRSCARNSSSLHCCWQEQPWPMQTAHVVELRCHDSLSPSILCPLLHFPVSLFQWY